MSESAKSLFDPVLTVHTEKEESFAEMGHNGQTQTNVCSQTQGVQGVDVISAERILGKFSRPTREWPSSRAENTLVTKTWAPLLENTPRECPLWGGGGDR